MTKFWMLVGLPGCGKSTWANEHKNEYDFEIISSDALRESLFGDINDQTHNNEVFDYMNKKVIDLLSEDKDVCYDATNINHKSRKSILNMIHNSNLKDIECIAVLFETPILTCYYRNKQRERKVPEYVIDKMLHKFEIPFYQEGFDEIISIIPEHDPNYELEDWTVSADEMAGKDQMNPHHTLDLLSHCYKCEDYILQRNDLYDIQPEVCMAALFHDYGKLFTSIWDSEKQICHYFNHENVGAYHLLFVRFPKYLNRYKIIFYVNYHMKPYISDTSIKKLNEYKNLFKDEWINLVLLHEGDMYAH